jgi:NADH-quinone oxidoreductase subunit M
MDLSHNILSLLTWLPIFGGIAVLIVGDGGDSASSRAAGMRSLSLAVSVLTFVLSIFLFNNFDTTATTMQFVERAPWIAALNVEYFFGVDGISAPLIILTAFLTPLVIIAGWDSIKERPAQYFAAFLILEGLMIGVFSALDGVLFYVLWEAQLVPMFLIIGVWGGERRIYATLKFFLYTFLGSVLMLVAFIYLYNKVGNFNFFAFMDTPLSLLEQQLIFIAFLLAFAVKVPMWPVHTWLPDAHVEAPTGGSVILAAIMLKMGGYGFVRLSLPMLPDGSMYFSGFMIALSLIAVVYIGFVALMQKDMKKLIAYSSIAHMGFVTLGFFLYWSTDNGSGAALRRRTLRPGAQQADSRLRWRRKHDAGLCDLNGPVRDGECRSARYLRVRRRIHGDHCQFQGQFLVRVSRGNYAGAWRCLHTVDGEASCLWRGGQQECR